MTGRAGLRNVNRPRAQYICALTSHHHDHEQQLCRKVRARVPNRFRPRLSDAASCSTSFRRLVWTSSNQSRRRSARAGVPCAVARLPEPFRGRAHRCSACSTSSPVLDQSRTSSWRENRPHPPERLHPPQPTPLENMNARACVAPPESERAAGLLADVAHGEDVGHFTPSSKHARPRIHGPFLSRETRARAVRAHRGPALAGAEGRRGRPRT